MDRTLKTLYRSDLFRHLDGIVTGPTAYQLYQSGILDYILKEQHCSLSSICDSFEANNGYMNVALRVLASQGWLDYSIQNNEIRISANSKTSTALNYMPLYEHIEELIQVSGAYHPRRFEEKPFSVLLKIFNQYKNNFGIKWSDDPEHLDIQKQVLKHIEGYIVGPSIVALGMGGMFHKYFMQASFRADEFHNNGKSFNQLLDIFVYLGWFSKTEETYRFTEKGLFFAKRASAYGVTVSYIPGLRKLNDLLFGNPRIFWDVDKNSPEIHVDRAMNVWGSGGAHSNYFKKIDEIIIDLFNKPLNEQPKGIVDMGCGNGAFLIHLFDVIEKRTLRGQHLDDHPLFLIGADYNKAALDITRDNLIQANIWAKVIWGDIGRPDLLAETLDSKYGIGLGDCLNVRTFLDHNRIWQDPESSIENETSASTGAFAFRGRRLSNGEVEQNLQEHFMKWTPYVARYGLLVIELHTISPELTAQNLGNTAATAYDATHGYSDQYIVEVDVFKRVAKRAQLYPVDRFITRYPDSDLATVSINLFKASEE